MQIVLVPIVALEKEAFQGAVYNIETEAEEYIVDEVVVHNCPHHWQTHPDRWPQDECGDLWMGE